MKNCNILLQKERLTKKIKKSATFTYQICFRQIQQNALTNLKMSNSKIINLVKNYYSKSFGILQAFQNFFYKTSFIVTRILCFKVCRNYSKQKVYIFIRLSSRNKPPLFNLPYYSQFKTKKVLCRHSKTDLI